MKARHWFEEHTSEVQLVAVAPTLAELFVEAARGVAELLAEDLAVRPEGPTESVELHARDVEALLVDWLNEVIFLSETRKRVFSEIQVKRAGETEFAATLRGFEPQMIKTAVKAATLHGARVEKQEGGFRASVVLDV
ncbi:MAG TPA: archease [Myxococcaceae bacterium]|nr:archease [Myxococcaceae bacterium]